MAHEKQLIPHYQEIKLEFKEALEDHNAAHVPSTMAAEFGVSLDGAAAKDGTNQGGAPPKLDNNGNSSRAHKQEDEREEEKN